MSIVRLLLRLTSLEIALLLLETGSFFFFGEIYLTESRKKRKREDLLDSEASMVKPKIGDRFGNEVSGDGEEFERPQEIDDDDDDVEILSVKESGDFVAVSERKGSPERGVSDEKTEDFVDDSKSPIAKREMEDKSGANASNQLVVYEPSLNDANQVSVFTEPPTRFPSTRNTTNRDSPSIGTFAAQCADCFKWRVVPTKEEYEAIRESIIQRPFVCEYAKKWRPDVSCDAPHDLEPDDSRIWAIDKPNISQPPPGWQRLLRIRGEGSTRFADVYYTTPTGKTLRSLVEVQKFLLNHPEFMQAGVNLSQFSFQIPKPLNDAHVRKRSYQSASRTPVAKFGFSESVGSGIVEPLAWVNPSSCSETDGSIIPAGYASTSSTPRKKHGRSHLKKVKCIKD